MKTLPWRLWLFLLAACLIIPNAYADPEPGRRADRVTVFAAASLKDAFDEIARDYETEAGVQVVVSLAASSALAKQIENGAPADVFISADHDWMDYLAARKLIDPATRFDLVKNALVLIAPKESRVEVVIKPGFPLAQLLGGERLAIADPDYVPAGRYAKAALQSLKVWDSVQDRLARADNVRVALAFVSRGEAPLGIVYLSDALAEPKVRIVGEFPPDSHPPIIYPAAVVSSSRASAAPDFVRYLRSEKTRKILERHGFSAP